MSWERTQRKRENSWEEIHPGKRAVKATDWVPQSWGPTQGRQAPLTGWRTVGTNRRAAGSLDSAHEECMWQSREGGEGTALVAARFPTATSAHTPAWAEQTLQLHLLHVAEFWWLPSSTAHTPIFTESLCRPHLPSSWLHNSTGAAPVSYEEQRGLAPEAASEQSKGRRWGVPAQAVHQRQLGSLFAANTSQEPTQALHASAFLPSRARVPVLGEGKTHT